MSRIAEIIMKIKGNVHQSYKRALFYYKGHFWLEHLHDHSIFTRLLIKFLTKTNHRGQHPKAITAFAAIYEILKRQKICQG